MIILIIFPHLSTPLILRKYEKDKIRKTIPRNKKKIIGSKVQCPNHSPVTIPKNKKEPTHKSPTINEIVNHK